MSGDDAVFHFSPDLLNRVVDALFLLTRSKEDVFSFLRNCGIPESEFADELAAYEADRGGTKKAWIARRVVERLNSSPGDRYLGYRRALIQRIVDWEDFSQCWPDKQMEAQGTIAVVRDLVNKKDAFTRMALAEEREREVRAAIGRAKAKAAADRRARLGSLAPELGALWSLQDPHIRGQAIERLMNDLFAVEEISIRDAFRVVGDRDEGVVEQIDGAIDLDGKLFLVEVKWHNKPLGPPEVSPHIVRVFSRAEACGLVISASGYTDAAVTTCREALRDHLIVLAELREIVLEVERAGSVAAMLKTKIQAALLDKNPLSIGV